MEFRRSDNPLSGYNSDQSDHFARDSDRQLSADEFLGQLRSMIDDRADAVLCMSFYSNWLSDAYGCLVCGCCYNFAHIRFPHRIHPTLF